MNLTSYLKYRGVKIQDSGFDRHFRSGWSQLYHCVFCGSDKWHLGLSDKGYFHCWQCGHHSVWSTLKELFPNENIKGILSQLDLPDRIPPHSVDLSAGKLAYPAKVGELLYVHRKYLQDRGFAPDELQALWGLGGIGIVPANPKFQWRIFIPVTDERRNVMSWTTRAVGDGIKYLAANKEQEVLPLKTLLYGEQYRTHYDTVVIVEGTADVWNIGVGACATFGTAVTQSQILRISQYARRIICFDNEPEAQRKADRLCYDLSLFMGETVKVNLDADDPAVASKKEISLLRKLYLD